MAERMHTTVRVRTGEFVFDATPIQKAFLGWGHGYDALAAEIGCSLGSAHRLVNGHSPRSKLMPKLASFLQVDLRSCWRVSEPANREE